MSSNWTTWSQLPVRRSLAVGVTAIEFRDLDANDYMLEIKGLQHNSVTPSDVIVQLSADGVTWDVTPANYVVGGAGATLTGAPLHSALPLDTYYAGYMAFESFSAAAYKTWMTPYGGRFSVSTGVRSGEVLNSQLVSWSALRITTEQGSTFSKNLGVLLREKRP